MPAFRRLSPRTHDLGWRRAVAHNVPIKHRCQRGGCRERRGRRRMRLGEHALLPAQHGHQAELALAANSLVRRPVFALVLGAAVAHQPAPRAHGRVRLAAHGAGKARARALKSAPARARGTRGGLRRRQRHCRWHGRQGLVGQLRQHAKVGAGGAVAGPRRGRARGRAEDRFQTARTNQRRRRAADGAGRKSRGWR
jgi:hypothetical protein